jgi:hypothetical protein
MSIDGKSHIGKILRVVKNHNWSDNLVDRESIGGEEYYVSLLQEVYEASTPLMKKIFCRLTRIYIESDMKFGAYAQLYRDKPGATLGIRKADIDLNSNLGIGLSRKEQLCFGRDDIDSVDESLPHFISRDKPQINNYLFYVVSHEFGHLIDWKNEISLNDGEWQSLSWESEDRPLGPADFEGRNKFKFYDADDSILAKINYSKIYENLYNSSFVSAYSSMDADEDFAETYAHINVFNNLETELKFIDPKSKMEFEVSSRINSNKLEKKVKFVQNIIERKDLIFP